MVLQNKVAVVTGGASGIGREIALAFASHGAAVAIADVNNKGAEEVAKEIEDKGGKALAMPTDVSSGRQVEAMVRSVASTLGSVDLLVNNAGIGHSALIVDTAEEDWDRIMNVNLKGQFLCAREAAKVMIRQGRGGRIINIASTAAGNARVEGGAYCASKAGVVQLTRVLALELGPHQITVNAIGPGLTDTALSLNRQASSEYRRAFLSQVSLGRAAMASDIAQMALFLASPAASYVTGQLIYVDGGYSAGKLTVRG